MTRHIELHWLNGLECRLSGDREVLFAIQEAFSFYAKGYQHMPLYKRGLFDGKIRVFKLNDCILPTGLIPSLREIQAKLDFTLIEHPSKFAEVIQLDDGFFIEKILPLACFEVMEHQIGAIEEVLANNKRLVLSPTSSGKSLIIYLCARYLREKHGIRTLIIVPNTTLVEQMSDDFREYATDAWNSIHGIYAGKPTSSDCDVVVSTYQTAVKMQPEWYKQFGAVFIDEAHGANSKSVTTIVNASAHMHFRAGFTGTLNGTYMHEIEMRARFGELTKLVTTAELMERGIVAKLHIDALTLTYSEAVSKAQKNWKYPDEIEFLTTYEPRNEFLANLASSEEGNVMILFARVAHGQRLKQLIEERIAGTDKQLFYVDGNVSIEDRVPIRASMEARNGCILLASFGTSSVGLSIKNIHMMVLGHPFKDRIRVLQTIGRGLRLAPGKTSVRVVDVGDWMAGKRKTGNHTHEHFLSRLGTYQEENFSYDVITLDEAI